MDFHIPLIADALAFSVVYDEYKGNFREALATVEASSARASQQGDPSHEAGALLARGLVSILQGETVAAITCFDNLLELAGDDPALRLRALTYQNLAVYVHYNTFPNNSGASALEIERRWDGISHAKRYGAQRDRLLHEVDRPDLWLEHRLVNELLVNVLPARSFVSRSQQQSAEVSNQLLDAALSAPKMFLQVAEKLHAAPRLVAYAHLAAADLCRRARRFDRANEFLRAATEEYDADGHLAGAAACQMAMGDWLAAPLSSPQVWNFAIQEGTESSDLPWTVEINEFTGGDADIAAAHAAYAEAARLFESARASRGLAALQLRHGYLAARQGDYEQALRHISQAQELFVETGDRLGSHLANAHRALSLVGAGHLPVEKEIAATIGTWGREKGSFSFTLGLGLLFSRAGRHWLVQRGDYQRALACYGLSQTLFEDLGAISNVAQSLVDQGMAYQTIGEPSVAVEAFEQARVVYAQLEEDHDRGSGAALRWRVAHLEQVIYRIHEDHRNTQGMDKGLARMKALAAQPSPEAEESAAGMQDTAGYLMLVKQISDQVDAAQVLLPRFRAVEARDAGDTTEADRQFSLAMAAAQEASADQRNLLVASVLAHRRRYEEAIQVFHRYLEAGGALGGQIGSLARLMSEVFGEEGAAIAHRQSENTHEQAALFFTVTKAYAEAKQHLDALEQMAGKEWWRRNARPWETLLDYGEVYEGLGEFDAALTYYDLAIGELEAQRRTLSRDELKIALASGRSAERIFFQAARTAVRAAEATAVPAKAQSYLCQGFAYVEQGKARSLLDLIAGSALMARSPAQESETMRAWRQLIARSTTWRGLLAQEYARPDTNENRIVHLQQQIDDDEKELERVERALAAANPRFYEALSPQVAIPSAEQVQQALGADTLLLQYAYMDEDLLAWAITRHGVAKVHRAHIDTTALEREIVRFQQICAHRGSIEKLGEELSLQLLEPFVALVRQHSHLIFVPYGAAHLLPFHVLPLEGEPLATTHTISYLPSASLISYLQHYSAATAPERILAVGNPANMALHPPLGGTAQPLEALPHAEVEASYVRSLFEEGDLLLGEQATEEETRRRLPACSLIHLATHGYLSDDAPLLSSILLANGEALTVYELMGMQLDAELVVLSACETGRGQRTRGDDVLGLTRGLLAAGARCALVSLWPVNDNSTSLFMGEFYRRLRAGDGSAVALQAAQSYVRRVNLAESRSALSEVAESVRSWTHVDLEDRPQSEYSHPYYWAPFILVGQTAPQHWFDEGAVDSE